MICSAITLIIYSLPYCDACHEAAELGKQYKMHVVVKDVTTNADILHESDEFGSIFYPKILIDGKYIGDLSDLRKFINQNCDVRDLK